MNEQFDLKTESTCERCGAPVKVIWYRGDRRETHLKAADTKACGKEATR